MSVCEPLAMAAHPLVWAGVGAANVVENHARVASVKRSRLFTTTRVGSSRDCVSGDAAQQVSLQDAYGLSKHLPTSWALFVPLGGIGTAPGTGEVAADRESTRSCGVHRSTRRDESGGGDDPAGDEQFDHVVPPPRKVARRVLAEVVIVVDFATSYSEVRLDRGLGPGYGAPQFVDEIGEVIEASLDAVLGLVHQHHPGVVHGPPVELGGIHGGSISL